MMWISCMILIFDNQFIYSVLSRLRPRNINRNAFIISPLSLVKYRFMSFDFKGVVVFLLHEITLFGLFVIQPSYSLHNHQEWFLIFHLFFSQNRYPTISIAMDIRCLIVIEGPTWFKWWYICRQYPAARHGYSYVINMSHYFWILLAPFCILGMIWILIDIECLLL